jgi:hypothetical protein
MDETIPFKSVAKSSLQSKISWSAAVFSGLMMGVVLLLLPQGIPWAPLTFLSGVMGRSTETPTPRLTIGEICIHFSLALIYAIIIAAILRNVRSWRGILLGGITGLGLYFINFILTSLCAPQFLGREERVVFTHVLMGFFTAAFYLGIRRRRTTPSWRIFTGGSSTDGNRQGQ